MRGLTSAELLEVWERGRTQPPPHRALLLFAAARPETPADELGGRTVGERDAALLALHELTFGPELAGVAVCPSCEERLDVVIRREDLAPETSAESGLPSSGGEPLELRRGDHQVRFRSPTSLDLVAAAGVSDADQARAVLLERCVLGAIRGGGSVGAGELPADVVGAVAERMAEADPLADIRIDLTCPGCGHRWLATFDPPSFLWGTIEAWAGRLLREVSALASAYGWTEADALALSPLRRQMYVQLAGRG